MSWMTDWEKDRSDREDEIAAARRKHGVYNEGGVWCAYVDDVLVASGPDKELISASWNHHVAAEPEADRVTVEFVQTMASKVGKFRQALKDQRIHVGIGSPPVCATCDTHWPCEEGASR